MKLILFLAIYFVPSIISITNKHPSAIFIVPLNLFLGWTVVGWIVALVWSVKGGNNEVRTYPLKHNIAKINSMKHACKCYMEMLTPGEQRVAIMLARELSFKDYFLFNNIIINSKYNITSQIDHIVVSKFGVFVIENKEFNGWVFGDKNRPTWTQTFQNGDKFPFNNPLRQNYSHIMALQEMLPSIKECFYSIVVFSGEAEIKTEMPENVVYFNNFISYLKSLDKVKLSEDQVQLVVGKLAYACQTINISTPEHVMNIHASKNLRLASFNMQPS